MLDSLRGKLVFSSIQLFNSGYPLSIILNNNLKGAFLLSNVDCNSQFLLHGVSPMPNSIVDNILQNRKDQKPVGPEFSVLFYKCAKIDRLRPWREGKKLDNLANNFFKINKFILGTIHKL